MKKLIETYKLSLYFKLYLASHAKQSDIKPRTILCWVNLKMNPNIYYYILYIIIYILLICFLKLA